MAGLITAIASVAMVLGAIIAWLLFNERRIATLEQAQKTYLVDQQEVRDSITALHERLDAYFLGNGPRARQKTEEK
jgi:hypothetical protein